MSLLSALQNIIATERPARSSVIPVRRVPSNDVAHGFADPKDRAGTRRIVVRVDDATFAALKRRAGLGRISLSEAVRRTLVAGLRKEA